MIEKHFKKTIVFSIVTIIWSSLKSVYNFEEYFFNNNFYLFNYFNDNHVKINDLKINESYLYKSSNNINIELALSALRGIEYNNEYTSTTENEKGAEINQWSQITRNDFYNKNIKEENFMKGMPEPYSINNITDSLKNIKLYFNSEDLENKEIIYKGNYIPKIYNNIFLILVISCAYLCCIKILIQGYAYGKNIAKSFIPRISTLFAFFVILKSLLSFLPPSLCVFFCLIITFYFYSISMKPCEKISFLENSKIKKEPIGWVVIVCSQSILIGNFIYHLLFTVNVLSLLRRHINNYFLLYSIYLFVLLFIASLIFCAMISNIFPAKKAQNFVFSFTSSYLIISCYTYFYNFFILRFLNDIHIFQIEPIMFFSYTPKFLFNKQNVIALFILFLMTMISLILPKWIKQNNPLGKKKKSADNTVSNKYDIFLNYFT